MKKLLALTLSLLTLAAGLTACKEEYKTKTYEKDDFSIVMSDNFHENTTDFRDDFTYYFESAMSMAAVIKEEFSLFEEAGYTPEAITLTQYAELVILTGGLEESKVKEEDGLTYFTYLYEDAGITYYYMVFVYKGSDAFWTVNLACVEGQKEDFIPRFKEWAASVQVD